MRHECGDTAIYSIQIHLAWVETHLAYLVLVETHSLISFLFEGTGEPISYVQTALSVPVKLNWGDDGKEYACVVTMGDYQKNTTRVLTVYCKFNSLLCVSQNN